MYQEQKELTVTEIVHPCLPQWRKWIDDAEKRGYFSSTDADHAARWDQCAIGEARQIFGSNVVVMALNPHRPQSDDFSVFGPGDKTLHDLGMEFFNIVKEGYNHNNGEFEDARKIVNQIENRLEVLSRK